VVKVMHLKSDNSVLKRRINHLEPEEGVKFPRPGPSLKPFEELTPRQQTVASYDLQSRVLKTSEERGILPSKLSVYLTYRSSYQHSKKIAASAKTIFSGKEIAPVKTVGLDQALWLLTLGEGFGKHQYRKVKASLRKEEVCSFPPYEDLSTHWKEKITVEARPLLEKDADIVIGMHYDPVDFIRKYMLRWLERMELEGILVPPGSYDVRRSSPFTCSGTGSC